MSQQKTQTPGGVLGLAAIALLAFMVGSLVVPIFAKVLTHLHDEVSTGTAETHTDCEIRSLLGGWLSMDCASGPVSGALADVEGDPEKLSAAIGDFTEFHTAPLTCSVRDSMLSCAANGVDMNAHLARSGYAAPAQAPAHIQRETWLATFLGFAGAIFAFLYEQRRNRNAEDAELEAALKVKRARATELLTELDRVKSQLKRALAERSNDSSAEARENLNAAADEALQFARDLASFGIDDNSVHALTTAVEGVRTAEGKRQQTLFGRINGPMSDIDKKLRDV